ARLIDSDLTTPGVTQALRGHPFEFTADRPGAYRFAISSPGAQYTLRLTGVASVALGGVIASNNLFSYDASIIPFHVHRGDAGAFASNGFIFDTSNLSYTVDKGNLRSVEG